MARSTPDTVEPDLAQQETNTERHPLYCINHPKTETLLRCSKCLAPICPKCAIRTPVGYRCPKCARGARSPLYALEPQHYGVAAIVALATSLIAGAIITQIGLLFTFLLAVPVGGLIGEIVRRSIGGKRGRPVQIITGVCIAMGAFAGPWLWGALSAGTFAVLPQNPLVYLASFTNISAILYSVLAIGAAIARLR